MAGEGNLEAYFKREAEKRNLYLRKVQWPGRRGAPDRMLAAYGRIMFVELKNPNGNGSLSPLQVYEIHQMQQAGIEVRVANTKDEIDDIIREMQSQSTTIL